MAILNQKLRLKNKFKKLKRKNILYKRPQRKGLCLQILIKHPKKPNSANRRVAKVRITKDYITLLNIFDVKFIKTLCYIPGMYDHLLKEHSVVLVQGGKRKDLPGINFKILRGKYDCAPVLGLKNSRSKYGTKLPLC